MDFGVAVMMSFALIDTWFVAQLGGTQLAAMSYTFPVVVALSRLGIGLMAGVSSVAARRLGRNDVAGVQRLATDGVILATLVSVIASVVSLCTIRPLFALLDAAPAMLPLISDYMVVWYLGFFSFLVPMAGAGVIRGADDAKLTSAVIITGAVVNLILDPLLIFGLLGFPRLELQGAGLATVLSRLVTMVMGYWIIHHRLHLLGAWPRSFTVMRDSCRAMLVIAAPAAGTNMIIPLSSGVVVALLSGYGSAAVAGYGAATRIQELVLVVFFAITAIIGPIVGQNLGAGKIDRVKQAVRLCTVLCLAFGLLVAVGLALTATMLMSVFLNDE